MAGGDAGSAGGSVAVKAESFDGLRSTVPPPLGPVPEGTLAAKAASFDMLGPRARAGQATQKLRDEDLKPQQTLEFWPGF